MGGEKVIKNYFAFEAIEAGRFTPPKDMEYSLDGSTFVPITAGTASPLIDAGETIYWQATLNGGGNGIGHYTTSAKYKVKGNLMSLYYGKDFEDVNYMTGKGQIGRALFSNDQNLVSASELELPALALNGACYYQMFYNCQNLIDAPSLPATTLNSQCYTAMFQKCASLVSAPSLPATTLTTSCYSAMFMECTSLTTAPLLPAETLASGCYNTMFYGCTALTYIKAMFLTEPTTSYTQLWVGQVASTGTFVKNRDATWEVVGTYGVPSGWTIETASE